MKDSIEILENEETTMGKSSLGRYVFNHLREAILAGKYKENDVLKENTIATELKVSRTPVREAIKQLELEGLVNIIPNKGATVAGFSIKDMKDIYEMRALLEGLCTGKAVLNMTDESIAELSEIVDLCDFYILKEKHDAILKLDNQFHEKIYKAAGSKMISSTLSDFHHYLQRMRRTTLKDIERAKQSNEEHKAIVNAIKKRDAKEAEKLANEHIRNSMLNIEKHGLW